MKTSFMFSEHRGGKLREKVQTTDGRQTQAGADGYRRMQTDADGCSQTQTDAGRCRRMQTDAVRRRQMQADARLRLHGLESNVFCVRAHETADIMSYLHAQWKQLEEL